MKQALYKKLAKYYDLIYSDKDYKKETKKVKNFISKYKKSKGKDLLEVACGTGRHLEYLKKDFYCTGVDINKEILKVSRKKHPKIKFKKANMINFKFNKKFDVITCLFSSIGHVRTYSNLKKTINNFYKHLKKGGVIIIEPWFTNKTYKPGKLHMSVFDEDKNIKISRMSISKIKKNKENKESHLEMHHLIGKKGKGINHITDDHFLGLFNTKKTLDIMKNVGFKAKFLKKGLNKNRGLFIGVKES